MIFHFMAVQNFVAQHHEKDFDTIFHRKAAENLVEECYAGYFYKIFFFETAQNFVAEHHKFFWHNSTLRLLKNWLQSPMKEILALFSSFKRFETLL